MSAAVCVHVLLLHVYCACVFVCVWRRGLKAAQQEKRSPVKDVFNLKTGSCYFYLPSLGIKSTVTVIVWSGGSYAEGILGEQEAAEIKGAV